MASWKLAQQVAAQPGSGISDDDDDDDDDNDDGGDDDY